MSSLRCEKCEQFYVCQVYSVTAVRQADLVYLSMVSQNIISLQREKYIILQGGQFLYYITNPLITLLKQFKVRVIQNNISCLILFFTKKNLVMKNLQNKGNDQDQLKELHPCGGWQHWRAWWLQMCADADWMQQRVDCLQRRAWCRPSQPPRTGYWYCKYKYM